MKKLLIILFLALITLTYSNLPTQAAEKATARDNYLIQNIDSNGWATGKLVSDVETGTATFKIKDSYKRGDFIIVDYNHKSGNIIKHHKASSKVRKQLLNVDGYKPIIKSIMNNSN
ncbi:hypothetical protein WKH56_20595 [Priestia sp. SB1]|uniref:hypothetical protein n=1 Tax=Priestia sp. SB1 TaxID=3132359 RepID=UPI003180EE7F